MESETICAIATAQGGAIGTIRVSGEQAISSVEKLFRPVGKPLSQHQAYTLSFGHIVNNQGELIDEVLVALFRAPHSYTGEDSVEITCHGSAYILQQVMQLLINNGCRGARPGEYTQRAFLNGKMDLSQAEAVADLIASTSAATHRLAMNQMRGGFSKELTSLRNQLLQFTSLVELELDFSEEDVQFADRLQLQQLATEIEQLIARLVHSFSVGNVIKNGLPVAIIGETNSGKSTLLNLLLHEEKAIVSNIHGTTRDVIEDTINLQGVTFRFIDTAGIRQTTDTIENLGIERTYEKIAQASVILWVIDGTHSFSTLQPLCQDLLSRCADKKLFFLFNKSDLITPTQKESLAHWAQSLHPAGTFFISAKYQQGTQELQSALVETATQPALTEQDVIVTNIRHYEALKLALESIQRVRQGLLQNLSGDLLSEDIRTCIFHLSDIVGEVTTDEVLGNIFSHFCIGK